MPTASAPTRARMLVGPARMRSNPNAVRSFIRYRRQGRLSTSRLCAARITVRRSGRIARASPGEDILAGAIRTHRKTAPVSIARVLIAALLVREARAAVHSVTNTGKHTDIMPQNRKGAPARSFRPSASTPARASPAARAPSTAATAPARRPADRRRQEAALELRRAQRPRPRRPSVPAASVLRERDARPARDGGYSRDARARPRWRAPGATSVRPVRRLRPRRAPRPREWVRAPGTHRRLRRRQARRRRPPELGAARQGRTLRRRAHDRPARSHDERPRPHADRTDRAPRSYDDRAAVPSARSASTTASAPPVSCASAPSTTSSARARTYNDGAAASQRRPRRSHAVRPR